MKPTKQKSASSLSHHPLGGLRNLCTTTALCAALLLTASAAFASTPRGIYSISTTGKKTQQATLDNPDVDGISLRQNWSDLEKTEGTFDFTYFDGEVARAATAGKPVLLRVMTMVGRPKWVDVAVKNAGGKFFKWLNNGVNTKIPVFWDPTFLSKKTAMITALGAHFGGNPTVVIVAAGYANAVTEDFNVPHTTDLVTQWLRLGYSTANMIYAAQTIIDATMTAFPTQQVTTAIGGTGNTLDGGDDVLVRDVAAWAVVAWPGRFTQQKNDLSTCIPAPPATGLVYGVIYDYRPEVGGQMITSAYNDTTNKLSCGIPMTPDLKLQTAATLGIGYNEQFLEIYEGDVVRYTLTVTLIHNLLINQL